MKNSLELEAEKRDKQRQLDIESQLEKVRQLRDYRRDLAKLNVMMIRTTEKPPSEFDIRKLQEVMWWFKK